jgi:hypothetical protein
MKNKRFYLGMLAVALVLGMTVVGCGEDNGIDPNNDSGIDPDLNGTWVAENGDELKLNDGSLEFSGLMKGTYTASDGKMTIQITQIHGSAFEGDLPGIDDSKWYSKSELKAALKKAIKDELGGALSDADIDEMFGEQFDEMFNEAFRSQTGTYSVNGNKLTIKFDGDEASQTFTKK